MPAENDVKLLAVGDIMLGEGPLDLGRGAASAIRKEGPDYPFALVGDCLRSGDVVFGNVEAVLSTRGVRKGRVRSLVLRGDPQAAAGLKRAGFNVVSLANNHALEHGPEALEETKSALSAQGIALAGVGGSREAARKPLVLTSGGWRIGVLAYCLVDDETAYLSVDDPGDICGDVARARNDADLVIVSLHWGHEYIHRPSPGQVRLAHEIIDSGCAVILGHHPHVLQGLEDYHGGLIAYSLGNFVFDMPGPDTRESVILRTGLSRAGVTGWEAIPVRINQMSRPEILSGRQRDEALGRLRQWSASIDSPGAGDPGAREKAYLEEVAACRSTQRRKVKRHFLRTFLQHPSRYSLQVGMDYAARRTRRA